MCVRTSKTFYGSFILAMGRSPGFGSAVSDFRPFQTRSRSGSAPLALNLAGHRNSPDRSTKSTQSGFRPPTACKHRVSGSFSLPSRGPFHRSFTVLFAIGHQVVFRLGGWSPRLPTGLLVSGGTLDPRCLQSFSDTWLSHCLAGLPMPFS